MTGIPGVTRPPNEGEVARGLERQVALKVRGVAIKESSPWDFTGGILLTHNGRVYVLGTWSWHGRWWATYEEQPKRYALEPESIIIEAQRLIRHIEAEQGSADTP